MTFSAVRRASLGTIVVATVLLSSGCGSSPALTPLSRAQPFLSENDHTHYTILSGKPAPAVSRHRAEAVALHEFGYPTMKANATLVSATVDGYCKHEAHGVCAPIISNRVVWIVLIPNQEVSSPGAPGHAGPTSITGSTAVLIDARSGAYLMTDVVPSS